MLNFKDLGYKKVSLEITNICNFKCIYCPYCLDEIKKRQMTEKEIYRAIDELKTCGGNELEYLELNVLGEPLTHPNISEVIQYAHKQGIKIKLITNGSLLSLENIDNILNNQPAILKISLESLNRKDFSFIRGTGMLFDDYLARVTTLIKRRLEYGNEISTIIQIDICYISRYYLKRIAGMMPADKCINYIYRDKRLLFKDVLYFLNKIQKDCEEFKYDNETLFYNFNRIKKSSFSNDIPLYRISDNIILTLKEYYPWVNVKNKYPAHNRDVSCMTDKMGILADGRVVLCCLDWKGETAIGNIFNSNLKDILLDSAYKINGLRKGEFISEICKRCRGYFSKRHKLLKEIRHWTKKL